MEPIQFILIGYYKKKIVNEFSKIKRMIEKDFEINNQEIAKENQEK